MASRDSKRKSEVLAGLGVPVVTYVPDRWLVWRKVMIFGAVLVAGAAATSASASLRGRGSPVVVVTAVYAIVLVAFGCVYVTSFVRLYRLPRIGRRLVGVGLTPDGLADALFEPVTQGRNRQSVATAVFASDDRVEVNVGGHAFEADQVSGCHLEVGIAGDRVWLLIRVGEQLYPLRLRGPVLGGPPG